MLSETFLRDVPLPPNLKSNDIYRAMIDTQNFFRTILEEAGINLSEIIQANNFSGVVSNVFTKKLSDNSEYKNYHDQRYPDLMHPTLGIGLEIKASNRPWKGGEGHNGHSGWHIIVCYEILQNGGIEVVQAEIANLIGFESENSDWAYQGSKRNENNSQRTETYITTAIGTAKLRDGSVYLNREKVNLSNLMKKQRQKLIIPIPQFSPFFGED